MAITSVSQLVGAIARCQRVFCYKTPATNADTAFSVAPTQFAGETAGNFPTGTTHNVAYTAGSGYTLDKSSVGAAVYANATTQNYLAGVLGVGYRPGNGASNSGCPVDVYLVDLLWQCRGMLCTAGGATSTVTTPGSLPARIADNGLEAEIWMHKAAADTSIATGTSSSLVVNYLDADGAARSTVSLTFPNTTTIGQSDVFRLPLANNRGVKQITAGVWSNSASSSGTYTIMVVRPITRFAMTPEMSQVGWAALGLPRIHNDAYITAFLDSNTAQSGSSLSRVAFQLQIVDL